MIRIFAIVLLLPLAGFAADAEPLTNELVIERARAGFEKLNQLYWSPTLSIWLDRPGDDLRAHYEGRRNPPWWSSANALEVMLDFMEATNRTDYDEAIKGLYELHQRPGKKVPRLVAELKRRGQWSDGDEKKLQERQRKEAERPPDSKGYYTDFRNEYLDDSGWWGIAWLKMYDHTKDPKYLETAKAIHAHMAKNWRPDKGGGVLWCEDPDKQKVNAITNSLFLILSARLYVRTQEAPYLDWAQKTYQWFHDNQLYDGTAVVDAPGHKGDYWTYNQGTYLGALVALYQATEKTEYLDEAVRVARTVLAKSGDVLPSGVIVEKLGTSGWDVGMFKGVFVRYLQNLRDALKVTSRDPEMVQQIDHVIRASAASLLKNANGDDGCFTISWEEGGTDRSTSFNTQVSGLAALTAVLIQAVP